MTDSTKPILKGLCQCGCGRKTNLIKHTDKARGFFKGEPRRFIFGHHTRLSPVEYIVDNETGCWVWQLGKNFPGGYGVMKKEFGTQLAHRIYYMREYGPLPPSVFICHHCDNPSCVNPAHLFTGTQKDNMQDCAAKSRTWPSTYPHNGIGEKNNFAKLTADDVRNIRRLWAEGYSQKDIAEMFPVKRRNINAIINRQTWAHLEDGEAYNSNGIPWRSGEVAANYPYRTFYWADGSWHLIG